MSDLQFKNDLKQLQGKFLSLYGEMQQLFLRHGESAPHAGKAVMPHLEVAKKNIEQLTKPVEKPTKLFDPGD